MLEHALILQVIIPLLAAPIALIAGRKHDAAWAVAMVATVVSFSVSLYLLGAGTLIYELGGWAAPLGIVYVNDAASSLVLSVVSGISALATFAARGLVRAEIDARDHALFYTAWLLTIAGMLGQVATGDAFNIFVFLEISSLSAYALIAMGAGQDRRALPAAFNYLILGTVGATFYVIGLGLLYMLTGTLNLADLATRLPEFADNRAAFTGIAFIAIGLFLKIALFPLHFWLAPAYSYAPSAVSTLMAATATKVSIYVLIRFLFGVFGIEYDIIGFLLLSLGLIGAFAGTLAAIVETNVKRLLAQSSIAQLGYMAMGIGLATKAGLVAAFIHLFNHALMKGTLFLAVGVISAQIGRVTLSDLRGAARQIPMTLTAILLGGLALLGVPLTAGFISKLYLIRAQIEAGYWGFAVFTLISSALALIYIWKIVETAYLTPRPESAPVLRETPAQWISAWILLGITFYFGMQATPLIDAAMRAALAVTGGV